MQKYESLLNVLDQIRREAPTEFKRYRPLDTEQDAIDQARARAFIHLYLKVRFGLLDFREREEYVTDGTNDGGLDAYYIDRVNRKIYLVQAKFRTTRSNFDKKNISVDEILKMDADRIVRGEVSDNNGNKYNGKVQGLIREIAEIEDVGRYDYVIVLLANVGYIPKDKLRRLVGEFPVEIMDHEKCYGELLFPVVSGTYYNSTELTIDLDLSRKETTPSRISYPVDTAVAECEITILFVPTLEIAKTLYRYRNSILRYNPRSYLSLSQNSVNREIADTIRRKTTNEFALYNNGITMLSEDTRFSERTGRPYRGKLHVKNPQIINGGQTAYTLSHIYEESLREGDTDQIFDGKEVMLKVITFAEEDVAHAMRLNLIEAISKATNQQTSVVEADRRSNDRVQIELQQQIFEEFGYFYERKKGEFFDGLKNHYTTKDKIIDREMLLRVGLAINGSPEVARRSSAKVLFSKESFDDILNDATDFRELFFGYTCNRYLEAVQAKYARDPNNKFGVVNYGNALRYGKFAVIAVAHHRLQEEVKEWNVERLAKKYVDSVLQEWLPFEDYAKDKPSNRDYFRKSVDEVTGNEVLETNFDSYYKVQNVRRDIERFFFNRPPEAS